MFFNTMSSHFIIIFGFSLVFASFVNGVYEDDVNFDQNYVPLWANNHITRLYNGTEVQLLLDQSSGTGFRSISDYGSGRFGMRMKLPDKNTSGIVTSFYLTSAPVGSQPGNHDELDFEFIGSSTLLQTNVFADDSGGREERYQLWFDPRKDFHLYEILWNQYLVVFYVDGVPVRVFKNYKDKGVNYISNPMNIQATIWSAPWAGPVNWKEAPFISSYRRFGIDGCVSQSTSIDPKCLSPGLPWNVQKDLSPREQIMHQEFRKKNVVYDYCLDKARQQHHPECLLPHIPPD
ncbi:hypothetical protein DCAR_0314343 [Daucus carota subsp. sativus]|uniref:Xyloglucan endotransglucosylase/hydrolase n=2 Tax=Daucus carota subsp. sativus TaxID=79200 RepID=A0AAF1AWI6_DAUCS|nr:hypothetical protein DCAR_0314343 [Daucus carota subsp. sativus]